MKEPEHFGKKDLTRAFFGSIFVGLSFALNGLLFEVSQKLSKANLLAIIFVTLTILTIEIYFIGYQRVKDKKSRPFGEFWLRRTVGITSISLIVTMVIS